MTQLDHFTVAIAFIGAFTGTWLLCRVMIAIIDQYPGAFAWIS